MTKLNIWISAARLRTLPLSISGILVGSALAFSAGSFRWEIFLLAIFTTIGFQVLSNFANDYGDGVKGTDNEDRIGPKRALQSGLLTSTSLKKAIILLAILTFLLAILLIYIAFGKEYITYAIIFLILGIVAIISAITYTVGKSAYGYHGLGDVFVFLFFGWVSVVGCYFLYTKQLDFTVFLPASVIGLLSVAVLNVNNMRDIKNDKKANKNTLVVKMGSKNAKTYHYFLVIGAFLLTAVYIIIQYKNYYDFITLITFLPLTFHLKTVYNNKNPKDLDPELKKVALSTFLWSVLFTISHIL